MRNYINNTNAIRRSLAESFSEAAKSGTKIDKTNYNAPKEIASKQIVSLKTYFYHRDRFDEKRNGKFRFLLADGSDGELMLTERLSFKIQTVVTEEIFSRVQRIIDKYNLVNLNGIECYTTGKDEEYSPTYLMAEYESGEELYFYMDGDPDSLWTGELLELFQNTFAQNGHREVLSSIEARTLDRFELAFNDGEIIKEYYPIMSLDEAGERIIQQLVRNTINSINMAVSEDRIAIPLDFYPELSEILAKLDLVSHSNGKSRTSRFKYGDNDFLSFCIGMKNLRQYNGFYVGNEIPDGLPAVVAEITSYIETCFNT